MTTSGRFSPSRARGGGGGPKLLDLARSKHKVTVSKVARQENGEGEYTACGFVGETIWALWGGCERGFASGSWCYVRKGGIIFGFANGVVLSGRPQRRKTRTRSERQSLLDSVLFEAA